MTRPSTEALAFPGQGVDPVHTVALLERHRSHPLVAVVAELTGRASWAAEDLVDTRLAQPCVVAAGLLATAELDPTDFQLVVAHSLGEITALAFTGALSGEAAVRLACRRAELGATAQAQRTGAMVAIMKLDADTVEWVRRASVGRTGGVLDLAVENGPRQAVLSGDVEAVRLAADLADAEGGVARILGIGGAYHTPLLVGFVDALVAAAAEAVTGDPVVPVVSATGAGVVTTGAAAPLMLGRALVRPVRWMQAMEAIRDLGVTMVVDAGPGRTLANLLVKTPVLPGRALVDDPDR